MGKAGRPIGSRNAKLAHTPICKVCGSDISDGYRRGDIGIHGNHGTRYCSDVCWDKYHKDRLIKKCHICQHCGIAFSLNMLESSQKYCSVYCGHLAKGRKREDRFCNGCGKRLCYSRLSVEKGNFTGLCKPCYRQSIKVEKPIKVRVKKPDRFCDVCGKKLHHEQVRYCGNACRKTEFSNSRHTPEKCKHCGIDFITKKKNQKFCSRDCLSDWWVSQGKNKESLIREKMIPGVFTCKLCGKSFESKNKNRIFCSMYCRSIWQKKNLSVKVRKKGLVDRKGIRRATRFAIFERDGFRCKYCGVRPGTGNDIKLELDHMVPICEGGTNDPGNLVTACNVCNSGKAHFKVKLRVVNPFKKKTIVEDDKPEQIGLFR